MKREVARVIFHFELKAVTEQGSCFHVQCQNAGNGAQAVDFGMHVLNVGDMMKLGVVEIAINRDEKAPPQMLFEIAKKKPT